MDREIRLRSQDVHLQATVHWHPSAWGVVVFAHGSGSNRFSPRNRRVAQGLHSAGIATVLLDLLAPEEAADDLHGSLGPFDGAFLSQRLTGAVDWLLQGGMEMGVVPLGLFGASTGAAAALITASARPQSIRALVSRGGRPDLAMQAIPGVRCPTLLIVGELDRQTLAFNAQAIRSMAAPHHLVVVPGAGHLFEEPGALEQVTALTRAWFCRHLAPAARPVHPT